MRKYDVISQLRHSYAKGFLFVREWLFTSDGEYDTYTQSGTPSILESLSRVSSKVIPAKQIADVNRIAEGFSKLNPEIWTALERLISTLEHMPKGDRLMCF